MEPVTWENQREDPRAFSGEKWNCFGVRFSMTGDGSMISRSAGLKKVASQTEMGKF